MEDTINYKGVRRNLHENITSNLLGAGANITGVTGWILIAEVTHGKTRGLVGISGDIVGDQDLPPWTARGWLAEILDDMDFYIGPDPEDEDD